MKKILALFVIVTVALSLSAVPVLANGPTNLIVNGDFQSGDTGFTTDYAPAGDMYDPGVYAVGIDPNDYHSAWASFGDHTSGTGNMMIVNGLDDGSLGVVWAQDVTDLECVPTYPVTTYTLYAGQTWDIGEVQVKTSATGICVRFVLTDGDAIAEGWLITEAHVAAAAELEGIPQKKGNPPPGKFPVKVTFEPGVTDTDWICFPYPWGTNTALIAAHAKIELPELGHMETYDFCVKSGPETGLVLGGNAAVSSVNPWGTGVPTSVNDIADCPCVAEWIWDAARATSEYADNGDLVEFVQTFDIIGTPASATLKIAADNAFAFSLNGGDEVDENLAADWKAYAAVYDFGYPYMVIDPNPSGWGTVYTYDVLSDLASGANTLSVTGVNADWNTTSWSANPGAVIFKLCGTSEQYVVDRPYDEETGWAANDGPGTLPFPGKNWATYFEYTKDVVCDYGSYLLEFYAASSYPTAPAELEVSINSSVVGSVLNCTATSGEWVKFSYVWDADVGHALIEIRDLCDTYSGDDFVIDDISFVKQ